MTKRASQNAYVMSTNDILIQTEVMELHNLELCEVYLVFPLS
jgi:hypothetical protein